MTVRCGTNANNASRIYCGTNQVVRAYCGTNLVFGSAPITGPRVTVAALTRSGNISARHGMGMVGSATSGIIFGGRAAVFYNDFYSYSVSGGTVTVTALTRSGSSISTRDDVGMVGSATSGIIFGGHDRIGTNNIYYNDFYSYSVSGGTVTVTALTRSGSSISNRDGMGMVGSATSGIIFGGYDGSTSYNDFYRYSVSGGTVTVTALTRSGNISARYRMGMVGTATSGIIFGGVSSGNVFYRYSVSGGTVTVTALTRSGSSISARHYMGMVGGATSGIIFGGYDGTRLNDFYSYSVSGGTVTVTALTRSGNISARDAMGMVGSATSGIIFGGPRHNERNDFLTYTTS